MNKNPHTPTPNKRKETLRFLIIIIPTIFVLFFGWLGLVVLLNKIMGLELSAERVLLGVIALAIGVGWAWLNLKGGKPDQEGKTLFSPPPPARNPIEKLMRGLFLLVGIVVYVAVAMMPDAMASSFLRIFSFGGLTNTLFMLALLGMFLVAGVFYLISAIKNKLLPHKKSEQESPYTHWYLTAMLNWVLFFVIIALAMLGIEITMK